ncbi:MAG: hypothetical protein AAF483_08585 [Planctomycetota bacterium]
MVSSIQSNYRFHQDRQATNVLRKPKPQALHPANARFSVFVFSILFAVLLAKLCSGQEASEETNTADLFGRHSANQTEVFVASDVPPEVKTAIEETLAIAVESWGSSGRLEYWVLGTDRKAAEQLANTFCKRRIAQGHMDRKRCLEDSANRDHGFLMYQEIGAQALKSGQPRGSAGHNGGAEWGFHRMTSSLPLGFASLLNIPGEEEQITLFHEYWHSIQNSFIQTTDHAQRKRLMGPVWFVEGSAVAMAEITTSRLWQSNKLRHWNNSSRPWKSFEERMLDKLKSVSEKREDCDVLLPDSYDVECRELAYEAGAWAVAYLLWKHGKDSLLRTFHPSVQTLGWEGSFQETFGQSSKEFEKEFESFLAREKDEQVAVLSSLVN